MKRSIMKGTTVLGIKTLFIITISTARMIFPGMPIISDMQPGDVPPEARAVSKSVVMTLSSSKRTDKIPSVKVTVPVGLKVGPFVKLIAQFPKTSQDKPGDSAKITAKTYWGSSDKIQPSQPKVEQVLADSPDPQQGGSYAYWPIGYGGEKIANADSMVAGEYTLTSNYCEGASITVDADQTYLAPVTVTAPVENVDPDKPIKVSWKKVPKAVGYIINAFGGNDKESINWSSGSDPDLAMELETSPVTKDKLEGYISKKVILAADVTSCTIPAGVFTSSTDIMLTVTAVGIDKIQTSDDIDAYVLVRSVASVALQAAKPAAVNK